MAVFSATANRHRGLASMVTEADIRLVVGRTLHAYGTRADGTADSHYL
jgi:hypothetical protein